MLTTFTTAATYRNDFGALTHLPAEVSTVANALLRQAIRADKLDAEYNAMTRHKRHGWIGSCLNYDIYDVTPAAVLVQRRETERTKYGTSSQKSYYIIRRCGTGVRVTEAPKSRVVKLSKIADTLGEVINTIEGRAKKPLKQAAPFTAKEIAYKIVEARNGAYFSVFDDAFVWTIGKARIEAATASHTGGYYVFPTIEAAKNALERNVVFNAAWSDGKQLALVECEISGRQIEHDNGKICVTFCRPIRVIEELNEQPEDELIAA